MNKTRGWRTMEGDDTGGDEKRAMKKEAMKKGR
jgi:hypothetical protein